MLSGDGLCMPPWFKHLIHFPCCRLILKVESLYFWYQRYQKIPPWQSTLSLQTRWAQHAFAAFLLIISRTLKSGNFLAECQMRTFLLVPLQYLVKFYLLEFLWFFSHKIISFSVSVIQSFGTWERKCARNAAAFLVVTLCIWKRPAARSC